MESLKSRDKHVYIFVGTEGKILGAVKGEAQAKKLYSALEKYVPELRRDEIVIAYTRVEVHNGTASTEKLLAALKKDIDAAYGITTIGRDD
jgi:hypothetical protein